MSAALQFPRMAAAASGQGVWQVARRIEKPLPTVVGQPTVMGQPAAVGQPAAAGQDALEEMSATARLNALEQGMPLPAPVRTLAFYRKHTEKLLLRYLYASMLVGRAPEILQDPLSRGWVSSRPVRSFEDAVIFVLDMEKCLARLGALDRMILSRVVLQSYTLSEAALLLRITERWIQARFSQALDQLTQILLDSKLLDLPHS